MGQCHNHFWRYLPLHGTSLVRTSMSIQYLPQVLVQAMDSLIIANKTFINLNFYILLSYVHMFNHATFYQCLFFFFRCMCVCVHIDIQVLGNKNKMRGKQRRGAWDPRPLDQPTPPSPPLRHSATRT
jgi:hypothetical protein